VSLADACTAGLMHVSVATTQLGLCCCLMAPPWRWLPHLATSKIDKDHLSSVEREHSSRTILHEMRWVDHQEKLPAPYDEPVTLTKCKSTFRN
jgi:hypothetical protein